MDSSSSPTIQSDQSAARSRTIPVYSFAVALALGALVVVLVFSGPTADDEPLNPACQSWDSAAVTAVEQMSGGAGDLARMRVSESQFRLRRARRNCREGWVNLACQDYRAVTTGTVTIGRRDLSASSDACPSDIGRETAGSATVDK
jgi:hypothetical protein